MLNETTNTEKKSTSNFHPSFEELSDYIFQNRFSMDYLKTAARINKHVMECPECYNMYQAMLTLREQVDVLSEYESERRSLAAKVFNFLNVHEKGRPKEAVISECLRFKKWTSFQIESMKESIFTALSGFSHPTLVTVMKSSTGQDDSEEVESTIYSSLSDNGKNRVSAGIDGTLTLYFDAAQYQPGQRVIVLSEDDAALSQMAALEHYDNSLLYVRFEDVIPGQYSVLLED